MKQSSSTSGNSKKKFQICLDDEVYAFAEKRGYDKAIFEGENVKGHVFLELAKPEMVKCVRLQMIGYLTKSSRIDYQDVLKYINNPENPGGTLQKALNPMKKLSIDSNSASSSSTNKNNKNNKNSSESGSGSKYDNISVLVDYDVVLWGKMNANDSKKDNGESVSAGMSRTFSSLFGSSKGNKSSKENSYENRKDMINHKFIASRLSNEPLVLPFSFKLCHISDSKDMHLPSSYKNGKCQIEYFLYATINRPWPSRNSVRIMKLRVLQKIKTDIPKYIGSLEDKKVKELKFMKYIKKGIIEMSVKLPQKAFCHRENIPIEITVSHLGMTKIIIGFAVGLYEICSYEDTATKNFNKYSFKLVSERFYEYQIKPGESNVYTVLNFPVIDGNCSILKKYLISNTSISTVGSSMYNSNFNNGNEDGVRNEIDSSRKNSLSIGDDDELSEEVTIKDMNRIFLKEAKIPPISITIDEPSKWPIKVEHKLRIVAITNDYLHKPKKTKGNDNKKDTTGSNYNSNDEYSPNENEPENNDYEEFSEIESQHQFSISPPPSPGPINPNESFSISNNNSLNSTAANSTVSSAVNSAVNSAANSRRGSRTRRLSYVGGNTAASGTMKDLFNTQNSENQKYINENRKYGIILGHLSNGDTPTLPKSKRTLDFDFDIVIGSLTRNDRIYGKESKLDEEIEDQYYNAILRKTNISNKLKLSGSPTPNVILTSSNQKKKEKEVEPDISVHTRFRTNSSESLVSLKEESEPSEDPSPLSNINKELPVPPSTSNQPVYLPQQPPSVPPRPMPPQYPMEPMNYQFLPSMPQYTNPQEFQPSAPPMDDLETPPPPYEYNPNFQNLDQKK